MKNKRRFLLSASCIVFASLLFYLSHPNAIFSSGLGFLGYVALAPVFVFIRYSRTKTVWLYGALYGLLSYGSFCSWLASFHPLTIYLICFLYAVICSLLFLVLKLAYSVSLAGLKFFTMATVWLSYEYIKTLGFLGFSYGIMGYTQWQNPYMLSLSSLGGVWLPSLACILSSAFLARFFQDLIENKKKLCVRNFIFLFCFCASVLLFNGAGFFVRLFNSASSYQKTVKVIAVQGNVDPWKGGIASYSANVKSLMSLTDEALSQSPDAQIVVWPETAFVPPLVYHYNARVDYDRYQLVLSFLTYLSQKDACFVVGNQHSVDEGKKYTDDYNAALVFDPKENFLIPPEPEIYTKQHLVPFTEWFPYEKIFPHLYKALLQGDTHLWSQGKECTVFEKRGLVFSTPICFEDTFGDGCRRFVLNGAKCFVNLSNDAWAASLACQMQHLSMMYFVLRTFLLF